MLLPAAIWTPAPPKNPDMINLTIRPFEEADAEQAAQLFYVSVHQGARDHYSKTERQAWAAQVPPTCFWRKRLASQITLMAVQGQTLAGFMTLATDGYIDLAFVAPDLIGKGVAKRLYDEVEAKAISIGLARLYTHASHLARVFFVRQGWGVLTEQVVMRNNVPLTNFTMEKPLNSRNN